MIKKVLKLLMIIILFNIGSLISHDTVLAANGDDVDYTFVQDGSEEHDDYDYKRLIKRSVTSIKALKYEKEKQDDEDRDVTNYYNMGDINMTTIHSLESKLLKGTKLDLKTGYVITSQKKYIIDLTDASWSVITNKEYIDVKDGVCSVIKYPNKEMESMVRATTMKEVDGIWRKVVLYFYIIPSTNTASMDKVRTIPIKSKDKLKIYNNSAENKGVTWETSNSKIASISKNGTLIGKSKGKCTVTATLSDGYTLSCKIIIPSSTESYLLKNAEGSYSGINYFADPIIYYYGLSISENSITNNPYEVEQLDRTRIERMDIFYVKIYDKYSGKLVEERTFGIDYSDEDKTVVSCLWWFNSSDPDWDYAILD